jgi:hypothetical protein
LVSSKVIEWEVGRQQGGAGASGGRKGEVSRAERGWTKKEGMDGKKERKERRVGDAG